MATPLTLTQTVALSGLIRTSATSIEEGMAISQLLINQVDQFGSSGLSAASQSCINNNGPEVVDAVKELPSCITGYLDLAQRSRVPASISLVGDNLLRDLIEQAQSLTRNGVIGLVDHIQGAYVFCLSSYDALGALYAAQQIDIGSQGLGFLFETIDDVLTMGMTNQFGNIDTDAYRELCTNLVGFGSMFPGNDLSRCFRPASVITQLFRLGFNNIIADALNSENISVDNYSSVADSVLIAVLNKLSESQVKQIVTASNFTAGSKQTIKRLGDIFNDTVLLGPAAKTIVSSLSSLQDKLVAVFGLSPNIDNISALGSQMARFRQPSLSHMPVLASDRSNYKQTLTLEGLSQTMGQGSGVFGNPTMFDVLGSFVGAGYTDLIGNILKVHASLSALPEGQSLLAALNAAFQQRLNTAADTTNAAAIRSAAAGLLNSTNPKIREGLNTATADFNRVLDKLINEKTNQSLAKIDTANTLGSVAQSMSFVVELAGLYNDTNGLGYGDFVKAAAADNIYGEAIRSVIDEGYNQSIMNDLAVEVANVIDPLASVQQLQNNQSIYTAQCCP